MSFGTFLDDRFPASPTQKTDVVTLVGREKNGRVFNQVIQVIEPTLQKDSELNRLYYFEFSIEVVDEPHLETRLYDAQCDDCLVCRTDGRTLIDFCRPARTYEDAVSEATADIEAAGLTLIHVGRIPGLPILVLEDEPPVHNSKKIIQHYRENVEKYVAAVVKAGRSFLKATKRASD
jgi:hypothetical protein